MINNYDCTNLMTFENIERNEMRVERERERNKERKISDRNGYPICNIWQIGTGPLG